MLTAQLDILILGVGTRLLYTFLAPSLDYIAAAISYLKKRDQATVGVWVYNGDGRCLVEDNPSAFSAEGVLS